jgi:hypothetical protein
MAIRATFVRIAFESGLPRSSHSLCVIGSKAYLFGGELRPREPVDNAVHVFDLPASGSAEKDSASIVDCKAIQAGEDAPPLRVGHTAARIGSDFYVFGGRGGVDPKALEEQGRLWKFSAESLTWSSISPSSTDTSGYPEARSYHASTASPNNIFVHAGCPASGRQTDLWSFDINSSTWTQLANAPEPARGGPGFTYALGRLCRYGGFDGKRELGGQLDYLDVEPSPDGKDAKWQSTTFEEGDCPGPRSVTGLSVVNIKNEPHLIAYLGERDASNLGHAGAGVFWGDIWALKLSKESGIAAEKWEKVEIEGAESLPERGWFASDVVSDDRILVYGGLNAKNEREEDGILISFS